MSYQNLKYSNIAGEITATYNDNNMRRSESVAIPSGPGLLMTATASQGLENQSYAANAGKAALQAIAGEFGAGSDVTKMAAAAQQVANETIPVSIMRIGAKPFHFIIEKATTGMHEQEAWITITPYATREEDTAAELQSTINQLSVLLQPFREGALVRQRVVIYNNETATPVYDSEGLIADQIAESIFDVDVNVPAGMFLWTPGAFDETTLNSVTLENIYDLADIRSAYKTSTTLRLSGDSVKDGAVTANGWLEEISIVDEFLLTNSTLTDYNAANTTAKFSFTSITGSAGDFISNCERYAANEIAYEELEFENISFLHCDRCYADTQPVDIDSGMELKNQLSWQNHNLGYMWKYVFNGRPHIFMSARKNPFTAGNVTNQYTFDDITYNISGTQQLLGDALNLVEFHFHPGATGTLTEVESYFNSKGLVECHIDFDSDSASLVDGSSLTEAEYEAYAGAGVAFLADANTDNYGWTAAEYASLLADTDFTTDNDPVLPRDIRTGLIESQHNTLMGTQAVIDYLADVYSTWAGSDAKGRIAAEFTIYQDAGHVKTIDIETPFCTLNIKTQRFDANDGEYIMRLRPSLAGGVSTLSTFLLDAEYKMSAGTASREFPLDPFFMNHFELTGNLIPEAAMSRLFTFTDPVYAANGAVTTPSSVSLVAANVEVREVSFLHQSATAAYLASTNYSQSVAIVPTTPPPRSRNGVSAWAGNPAEYQIQTNGDVIVTSNGTGVLGTKLLAGATTYRGGAAFGGIILTNGDLLPNETPYGIDDTDEALDAQGNPIDLGKHVIVVGAYGLLNDPKFSYPANNKKIRLQSQNPYLGSAAPLIAGVLAIQAPGTEPIGPIRGRLQGFNAQQRTPRAILNNLAALRICMIDQTGIISSIYTAALRTSDYTKVSSILSANSILSRLRQECLSIIGSAYTDTEISSLAQRLDGVSKTLVGQGYAQQLSVQLRGSRLDRINGIIRMAVRFIPPLSVEAVEIDLTLEPPASGI
jgi:hypothetical protein